MQRGVEGEEEGGELGEATRERCGGTAERETQSAMEEACPHGVGDVNVPIAIPPQFLLAKARISRISRSNERRIFFNLKSQICMSADVLNFNCC